MRSMIKSFLVIGLLGSFGLMLVMRWGYEGEVAALKAELAKKTPLISQVGMSIENIRKIDFRDIRLIEDGRPVHMLCTELRQGRDDRFFLRSAVGPDNVPGNMWVTLPLR